MGVPPSVGVVVLNHDGGDLTLDCLRSLIATRWPPDRLRIVLVDNASSDGVVARVRAELPTVEVVESAVNTGFAGGCNLGMAALAGDTDHVALVNNDATVDPDWLEPLVEALASDPRLGAASPKILFAGRFRDVELHAPTHRPRRGGRRELGLHVSGARVDGADVWGRAQLVRGFWGPEAGPARDEWGEWSHAEALLRLPDDGDEPGHAELRLSAGRPLSATVRSGSEVIEVDVDTRPTWVDVPFAGDAQTVVNNVGTSLTQDRYGIDRGYFQPDDGRFDAAEDVFAWCGAGVLLRGEYLKDVGVFDERLFLYYEDLELAWRGGERGWKYRFVPASRVSHVHTATSIEGSALKDHYNERNRLLVLARHASGHEVRRASLRYLASTASYARRDIAGPLLRGEQPRGKLVTRRLRAFGAFLRQRRSMRRSRARDLAAGARPE